MWTQRPVAGELLGCVDSRAQRGSAAGYRRLTTNFPATLAAITKLEIYRTSTYAS
jgi:hypothetical protein